MRAHLALCLCLLSLAHGVGSQLPWTEAMEMDLTDELRRQVEAIKSSAMVEQMLTALPMLEKLSLENLKRYIEEKDLSSIAWLEAQVTTLLSHTVSSACLSDILQFLASVGILAAGGTATGTCYYTHRNDSNSKGLCDCLGTKSNAKLEGLALANEWVMNVIDAQGKPPAGILQGNLFFLGSFQQCRSVRATGLARSPWNGEFCVAQLSTYESPRKPLPCINATHGGNETEEATRESSSDGRSCSRSVVLKYGLCVPDTCSSVDVENILNLTLGLVSARNSSAFCKVHVDCKVDQSMDGDWAAILMLSFCVGTWALMILSSLYDITVYRPIVPAHLPAKEVKAFHESQPSLVRVLIAFSIPRNVDKVMETTKRPGQIECLMGIRFISLTWVILGHTYYWALPTLDNPMIAFKLPNDILNQIILNASFCVDAFYVIGGCLLVYLWFKGMDDAKGKPIKSPLFWVMFYVHRFIRLTPVYMIILGIDATLYKYAANGPLWNGRGLDADNCKANWWTNLLYINNLVELDNMCMSWTWYLANDFQFYLFSPLLLLSLWYSELMGFILGGAALLLSGIIQAAQSMPNNWPPISIFSADPNQFDIADAYWKAVYVKPWIRCRPYIVGMLLGYILYKRRVQGDKARKVPLWFAWLGWGCALASSLGVLFGLYDYSRFNSITDAGKVIYAVFGRSLWALSLAWVVFACSTGHGGLVNRFLSWKGFMPLAKITYCAYLIHPYFVHGYYSSRRRPLHFGSQYQMIQYFFAHVIVSYAAAFVCCISWEIPVLGLEEIIFPRHRPKKRPALNDGADQNLIPSDSYATANAMTNPNYSARETPRGSMRSNRSRRPPPIPTPNSTTPSSPDAPVVPGMEAIRPGMTSPFRRDATGTTTSSSLS